MDSYSEHRSDFDSPAEPATPQPDVSAAIGTDERRMHVRAYNHWVSLLDGRDYPSIEDLEPGDVTDFAPHSVLLDFTAGRDDPATAYIGEAVRAECDLPDHVKTIADVPSRSLLSRLTDHYMQIIANRAPVGFEAEFVNQRGHSICYRGILMPFSSDGDTIDFIYGVINWKDVGTAAQPPKVLRAALAPIADEEPDEDGDDCLELDQALAVPPAPQPATDEIALDLSGGDPHPLWEDGPLSDDPAFAAEDDADLVVAVPAEGAGLADHLCAARESAEICKQADGRSRAALYRALAMAYDFAVATRRVPDEYAEILDDAGVKAQARAPMTPIVKLVFGIDYDKTRLTEFAAALSHAERCEVDFGGFLAFIEQADGGLKGLVAAERKARRPDAPRIDRKAEAVAALRRVGSLPLAQLPTNEEFALVITRRNANGVHEVVSLVSDEALLERAMTRAAAPR